MSQRQKCWLAAFAGFVLFQIFNIFSWVFVINAATIETRQYSVAWDKSVDAHVDGYRIYLVNKSVPTDIVKVADIPDGNTTTASVIVPIESTETYYLQMTAYESINESALSLPATWKDKVVTLKVVTTLSTVKVLELLKILTSGFVVLPK